LILAEARTSGECSALTRAPVCSAYPIAPSMATEKMTKATYTCRVELPGPEIATIKFSLLSDPSRRGPTVRMTPLEPS
jgi:hypothetical protein